MTTQNKIKYLQIKFEESGLDHSDFINWLVDNWDSLDLSQADSTIATKEAADKAALIAKLESDLADLKSQ